MSKIDKIKIEGTMYDRRRKLSPQQTAEIRDCFGHLSTRKAARQFNVSRRLIQFIWYPERLEHNRMLRKLRGTKYNTREELTRAVANLRQYKRKLLEEGKVQAWGDSEKQKET